MSDVLLIRIVLIDVVLLWGTLGPMLMKIGQSIRVRLFCCTVNSSVVVMVMNILSPFSSLSSTSMLILNCSLLKLARLSTSSSWLPSILLRSGGVWGDISSNVVILGLGPIFRVALSALHWCLNYNCLLLRVGYFACLISRYQLCNSSLLLLSLNNLNGWDWGPKNTLLGRLLGQGRNPDGAFGDHWWTVLRKTLLTLLYHESIY